MTRNSIIIIVVIIAIVVNIIVIVVDITAAPDVTHHVASILDLFPVFPASIAPSSPLTTPSPTLKTQISSPAPNPPLPSPTPTTIPHLSPSPPTIAPHLPPTPTVSLGVEVDEEGEDGEGVGHETPLHPAGEGTPCVQGLTRMTHPYHKLTLEKMGGGGGG